MAGAVTKGEGTADTLEWKKFDAETKLKEAEIRQKNEELKLRREEMIRQDENKKEEMRLRAIEL